MKLTGFLTAGALIATLFATGCNSVDPGNESSDAKNLRGSFIAKSGKTGLIAFSSSIKDNCTTDPTSISVRSLPRNGTVNIYPSLFPVTIPKSETRRYHCNGRKFYGAAATYTSNPGFVGSDRVKLVIIHGSSDITQNVTANIRVVK